MDSRFLSLLWAVAASQVALAAHPTPTQQLENGKAQFSRSSVEPHPTTGSPRGRSRAEAGDQPRSFKTNENGVLHRQQTNGAVKEDQDHPKITDWIQAIGTIIAILLSTLIAIVVPLYIRYLDSRRYRLALGSELICMLPYIDGVRDGISLLGSDDLVENVLPIEAQWNFKEEAQALHESLDKLKKFPTVLLENGSMLMMVNDLIDDIVKFERGITTLFDQRPVFLEEFEGTRDYIDQLGHFLLRDVIDLAERLGVPTKTTKHAWDMYRPGGGM